MKIKNQILNRLHTESCAQQGTHKKPSDKILRSPLLTEFWMHYVDTRARKWNYTNLNKYLISTGNQTHNQRLQPHFVPPRHDWPHRVYTFTLRYYLIYRLFEFRQYFISLEII